MAQQQAQQQAQSQAQQQAQSQGQAQAQSQSQGQSQAQSQAQGQSQGQAQAQAQSQSGLGGERQRERQVDRAHISSRDAESGTHLATGVRQSSPVGPAALWAGLVAVGLAIAMAQQTKAPTPARRRSPGWPTGNQGSARLPTERIRGRQRSR